MKNKDYFQMDRQMDCVSYKRDFHFHACEKAYDLGWPHQQQDKLLYTQYFPTDEWLPRKWERVYQLIILIYNGKQVPMKCWVN